LAALLASAALAGQVTAQATGTVSGRVTDAAQQPISRARVTVANRMATTALDGSFVVSAVPAGTQIVRTVLLGYREAVDTVVVTAGQITTVAITMEALAVELTDIVVIGYGEQEKRDVTGVVTEVTADQFNTGRVISAEGLIRGKVAGVQVSEGNGGEPGGGMSVRIRGGTSITSSNEPLYVIDGVPLPVGGGLSAGRNPTNFLNPEDIESITVLKDASSTAIYGSQGANGVVLIQTRSGRGASAAASGWAVTYRGTVSGSKIVANPTMLNADQFRQAVIDFGPPGADTLLGNANTNWLREVEQSGFGQEHTVVVAGGAEKTSFRSSLGYLRQDGVLKASRSERLSLNLAFNQLLFNDRLSLQANLMGARTKDQFTPGGVLGSALNMAPTEPVFDTASIYGGYFEWDNPLAANNPVGLLNLVSDEGVTYRSLGNLTTVYSMPFLPGLSATARVGYVVTNAERRFFAPSNNKGQTEIANPGVVSRFNPTETSSLVDGFLTYDRTLNNHQLSVTGGYAYTQRRQDSPYFEARGLTSNQLGLYGVPTAALQRTTLFVEEAKLASWFGRANYSFRDRYLLTATVRRDGSSKFGPGNQWGTFPSAAVAWRISEEAFLGDAFSDLKLRLSWGKNGNQAFASYLQYKAYQFGDAQAQVQFGPEYVNTIRPSAADPNIKWEETTSWNLGLDYGLWDNRVSGALELYNKKTKDLIFDVIVPSGTNLSNVVTTNVGSMKNRGIELTLNALMVRGADGGFSWDANFNAAYNSNQLVVIDPFAGGTEQILTGNAISGGVGTYIQVLTPGQPVNSFFVYQHKRDASGNPIYEDNNGLDAEGRLTGLPDGNIDEQDLYVDQPTVLDSTGQMVPDGRVNQDDRRPFHSPAPKWILGHTSQFRYRNFDMGLTLLAQVGNYAYNNVASSTGFYDQLSDAARPNNLHSSVLDNGFENPQYFSDSYVENASFLRLENIELGYTFRGGLLDGARVFGVIQNVFTLTGYSGIDPAATISGIDNNIYPRSRTFTGGLSLTF
jgi:iron complex outermembrane receptor protein